MALSDPAWCIRLICMIAGFGVVLETLQYLSQQRLMQEPGMWSWSILKRQPSWLTGLDSLTRFWALGLGAPGFMLILGVRVSAGLLLFAAPDSLHLRIVGLSSAFLTRALIDLRHRFMLGAENILKIVIGALMLVHLSPHDRVLLEAGLWCIALHSVWSYCANGWVKWQSPAWRSGIAMQLVVDSQLHRSRRLSTIFQLWPALTQGFTWSALIIETVFPLVLFFGEPACWLFLGWGVLFHSFNAMFIGLNTFLPSFLATYPAIWFVSTRIASVLYD